MSIKSYRIKYDKKFKIKWTITHKKCNYPKELSEKRVLWLHKQNVESIFKKIVNKENVDNSRGLFVSIRYTTIFRASLPVILIFLYSDIPVDNPKLYSEHFRWHS